MSLEDQERALFELLFDAALRARFGERPEAALAAYDLTPSEASELAAIDAKALELDARMRRDLILHRLCRALPITFCLASSAPGGFARLAALVTSAHLRTPFHERTARFGDAAQALLAEVDFGGPRLSAMCNAIIAAEVALTWCAARLRDQVLAENLAAEPEPAAPQEGWRTRPLALAAHVCMAVLPRPFGELKRSLCPCDPEELWARLEAFPLPHARLVEVLRDEQPRLFLGRAVLVRPSRCDSTVTHRFVELSHGFAPILRHVDGATSADALFRELVRAGASANVIESVEAGFARLLQQGMLRCS